MKIIDKYITSILIQNFLSSLGIIGGLLLIHRFYKVIEIAITRALDFIQIINLLFWVVPIILFHSMPISIIIGTLLTFGRLSSGSEICAILASGTGRARIALFPILLSVIISFLSLINNLYVVPEAYTRFDSISFGAGIDPFKGIKPGRIERIEGRHISVSSINYDGHTFQNFFVIIPSIISNKNSEKVLILAESGGWNMDSNTIFITLQNGSMKIIENEGNISAQSGKLLKFNKYNLEIQMSDFRPPDPKRRSTEFLLTETKKEYRVELIRRILSAFIFPFFTLISIPLAASTRIKGRMSHTRGTAWYSTLIYFLYWILFFISDSMVLKNNYELYWLLLPHLFLAILSMMIWKFKK